MARGSAGPDLVNQLDALFRLGVVGDQSDGQLVRRFLAAREEADRAAFTALVERHGPMVLRVCREVLGDADDARDAFQATFLVLARKAGSVRKADSLASWLHGVALRVAMRAKVGAARRRVHERRGAAMKAAEIKRRAGPPESWPELHEEVARLPERYREPVVLYYLEGLTTEETALRIGCPRGTILSRLSRARERLRRQLDRRGLAPSAAWLTAGVTPRARAALPATLLHTTVEAARGFAAAGRVSEAALASTAATTLANGELCTMILPKLKTLGALALACGLAWGGVRTFGQLDDPGGAQKPPAAKAKAKGAAARFAEALRTDSAQAVSRLAGVLKRHPARLGEDRGYGYQVYMLDLLEGGTTLIVDEPIPDQVCSGIPRWSHDGSRIVFDNTGSQWPLARLLALEARDGRPAFTDLGAGNNPTFSPDDRRIAFLLHPDAEPGAEPGIWIMRADGSGRRRVGEFGAPFWSPDGREFLINSYTLPTTSTVINLETKEGGVVEVPGYQVFSWPSWAGPGTLISALATRGEASMIALLDVRKPAEAKVLEILWKRGEDLDVIPRWPVYRPDTRRCFFVGEEPAKRTLYSIERGEPLRAKPTEVVEHRRSPTQHQQLAGLCFSPDGRYLIFSANRLEQK